MSRESRKPLFSALARASMPVRLAFAEPPAALRRRIEETGVARSYFICTGPRSGSTLLVDLLASTGLVGRAGEYFGVVFHETVVPRLNRRGFDDYVAETVRERSLDTGVFGCKLHWYQLADFLYLLRLRRGVRRLSDRELIEAIFPQPRFVSLVREDTLAQAVSWRIATATAQWEAGFQASGTPRFDFREITELLRRIEERNLAWHDWFGKNHIQPLRLTYEQLCADPSGTVRQTLEFIGLPAPDSLVVEPRTQRQANEINERWIRRYRELAVRRS